MAGAAPINVKLKVFRSLWGVPGPRDAAIAAIQEAGYEGIEAILLTPEDHAELKEILSRRRISFKGTIWTRDAGHSVEDHLRLFDSQLGELIRTGAESINAIGGYDCWSQDEAARYFEAALKSGAASGVPVAHEIHRNSALFHPTAAVRILEQFPELRLTCDFSHWVVACERLIDDQIELIRLCGARADHIHARVGTEEAPQIADIRAPEALPHVLAFERWWDIVWEEQFKRGAKVSTLCPEFGPPPYLPTLTYSGNPVADLAGMCDWQMERQLARFKAWIAARQETG
jgi:sugar phosphate isomerase/epimerase